METIRIDDRSVGENRPCYIIAEAGANFRISDNPDDNYNQAIKLIDIATDAGADIIKFQLYRADRLYIKGAGSADYLDKEKDIYDLIKDMELPYDWLQKLKTYCDKRGIEFMATPFDKQSVDELEKIGVKSYKIASYSITDIPFLKYVAKKGKKLFISTGASNEKDIEDAVACIKKTGNNDIMLMQCTAKYPAPLSTVNLKCIPVMKEKFGLPVGLSDHSREPLIAPLGAVALGAEVIEKHFTTDNSLPGPDHGFAVLPKELKEMVSAIRNLEQAMGDGKKEVQAEEAELHKFARHFIFAIKDIEKGKEFTEQNIACLRPGKKEHGLEPKHFEDILGKKAKTLIKKNSPVQREDVR